jgi:hypothetical protein
MSAVSATIVRIPLLVALVLSLLAVAPVAPAEASSTHEQEFVQRLNQARRDNGLPTLGVHSDLTRVARQHSRTMASQNRLHHNATLSSDVTNWQRLSENVGVGPSTISVHTALMGSTGHRANILDHRVTQVGVGVEVRDGRVWVTQVFRLPSGAAVPSATAGWRFSDVPPTSTHGADIVRLADARVTAGCGGDRFCPSRAVTRAEMASFLVRAMGLPSASGRSFTDVSGTHAADIEALARSGITRGCNPPRNDRFCPGRAVTRAEMATFLVRAAGLPSTSRNLFSDVGGTHRADINALARSGVTRGCNPPTNDRFCPDRAVSRAEMATFLVRGFGL